MNKNADAVQAGLILGCGAVMLAAGYSLEVRSAASGVETVLAVGLSLVGLTVVGLWFLALLSAIVIEVLGRRGPGPAPAWAVRWTPVLMRRLAVALLGANVLAVPAVAQAAPDHAGVSGTNGMTSVAVLLPAMESGTAVSLRATTRSEPPTVSGAPDTAGSPYWEPEGAVTTDLPAPAGPTPTPAQAPERTPAPAPAAQPTPATPPSGAGWAPSPVPADGGPLVRAETRNPLGATDVVVAPGDSLWSIVAARLGPLATDADVAATWPSWYEANSSIIGPDPCLLLPGQVLSEPS
ncbi:LysM peptidoglycan-binding domain-containing protein [Arthrobacter echini]|uniref:LysM peptidoglycan-binding domain-containing protein n=1 Tax=Arthrobacter echini TaxID=1529066 RepID=A0A4S5E3L5_9MICC|nr:LysM domain-containing protein [Arthrobacter echini]THJ65973.1 LysM peptidoglycan-binding domain-containing protein [Arthrobacter echini]